MKPEDIRKLLGGYATGTLTAQEREALFEAALDDQELFDALAKEQPLRELLEDPAARAHLLAALDDGPLPWPRRFEQWLWGHAVGLAAVACFLTVGGYVAWQSRDWRRPALMAELERKSMEVREPALPDIPLPHRAFDPGAVSKKPAPAVAVPAPPMVAAPARPAPANLPIAQMAPAPPPPPPKSLQSAARVGAVTESVEVTSALPLLETQTAPGAPPPAPKSAQIGVTSGARPGVPVVIIIRNDSVTVTSLGRPDFFQTTAGSLTAPSPVAPLPVTQRGAAGGVAGSGMGGGVGSGGGIGSGAAGGRGGFGTAARPAAAPKSARELYDPSLPPVLVTPASASAQAGGGGGRAAAALPAAQAGASPAAPSALGGFNINGGQAWQTGQYEDAAPTATMAQGSVSTQASLAHTDATTRPAARLGVRYQVLRQVAGAQFQELPAGSDLAVGDTVKLRFIPNSSGSISALLADPPAALLQSDAQPFAPVETDGIRVSNAPARLEMYVLFTREEQPRVSDADARSFGMKVRQGASGIISQAAGMEGVYVVNPAPGAPAGVAFVVTLNFQ